MQPLRALCLAFLTIGIGCTPVRDFEDKHRELSVSVDAAPEVRAELDDVEVVLESRRPDANSWRLLESQRFTPDPGEPSDWPLAFSVNGYDASATYQVTATARDEAGAVTIQARVISEPGPYATHDLRLRFDRECLRPSKLCGRTRTCSFGECIDAREPVAEPAPADGNAVMQTSAITTEQASDARAGDGCSSEGARACATDSENLPLTCEQGQWREQTPCSEPERCDSSDSTTHGTCRPVAAECSTRQAGELFCDSSGDMYQCQSNQIATEKACNDNEHCVDVAHDVRCDCLPGFVADMQGCLEANDCRDQGGCDPLTNCQMQAGVRTCSECPPGHSGTGETGCAPLLSGLNVSPGTLAPMFDPNVSRYSVTLPLLTPHIRVEASSMVTADLMINNASATFDATWTSPVLAPGQTTLPLTLRAHSGVRTDYQINVQRADKQDYLKPEAVHAGDWFGAYLSGYGDTLVIGAPNETVNGLSSAGAAYVFVRDGAGWRQQARLISDNGAADDLFGASVSIWENRIAIGNPGNIFSSIGASVREGSVQVWTRTGDKWDREETIKLAESSSGGDGFGFSVVLNRNTLLIGAPLEDTGVVSSGAAYVYNFDGAKWQQGQLLKAPSPQAESHFGTMSGMDADTIAVSAWHETVDGNTWAGAVYTFARGADGWALRDRILAPTVRPFASFGAAVSVREDLVVVSAPHNPPESSSNRSGEVHIFKHDGTEYRALQSLEAPQPNLGDRFGNHVVLSATALIVGAPGSAALASGASQAGAAYLYAHTDEGFVRTANLSAANADAEDHFGYAVAVTDTFAAVAAIHEDGGGSGAQRSSGADNTREDSGAVYVFE